MLFQKDEKDLKIAMLSGEIERLTIMQKRYDKKYQELEDKKNDEIDQLRNENLY